MTNPASLPVALGFGAAYAVVLLLSAWVAEHAGASGLVAVAAVSGLTDVDAITLSNLRLFNTGAVTANMAAAAVVVAFVAASAFKLTAVLWLGGRALMKSTWLALLAPVIGAAFGIMLAIQA